MTYDSHFPRWICIIHHQRVGVKMEKYFLKIILVENQRNEV